MGGVETPTGGDERAKMRSQDLNEGKGVWTGLWVEGRMAGNAVR